MKGTVRVDGKVAAEFELVDPALFRTQFRMQPGLRILPPPTY
jgi:hypothetical protein